MSYNTGHLAGNEQALAMPSMTFTLQIAPIQLERRYWTRQCKASTLTPVWQL